MSRRSATLGGAPTRTIVNALSSGGVSVPNVFGSASTNLGRELLSGALTAGVLKKVLEITVPGRAPLLSVLTKDATPRTVRIQVVIDGVIVFDATSNSISATNSGIPVIGTADATYYGPSDPAQWNANMQVWVASSLTETDKVAIAYKVN